MEVWRCMVGEEPPPTIPLSSISSPFVDRARSARTYATKKEEKGGEGRRIARGKVYKRPADASRSLQFAFFVPESHSSSKAAARPSALI